MSADPHHLAAPTGCRAALALDGPGFESAAVFRLNPALRRLYVVAPTPGARPRTENDPRVKSIAAPAADQWADSLRAAFQPDALYFAEGKVALLLAPDDFQTRPELCSALACAFKEFAQAVLSSVALHATRGWHMLANTLLNLPRLARENSMDDLRGRGRGYAAVVVGAGPSLDLTVRNLRAARDRLIVIACDAACSALAHADVRPDLIVTTDDSERVWRHFARLPADFRALPVAALTQSAWPVIRHHPGPIYAGRAATPAGAAIDRIAQLWLPVFDTGQCVGHAALETAAILECSPIVLTGFDLGYREDRFHAEHMQTPYFHDHPPPEENLMTVPGNDGRPIRTDLSMFFYLREFERRIERLATPVINATEGGAAIRGAPCMPLAQAVAQNGAEGAPPQLAPIRPRRGADLERLRHHLSDAAARFMADANKELDALAAGTSACASNPPFPFLDRHRDLVELISETENLAQIAQFRFAWEDGQRDPACLGALHDAARTHLREMAGYAGLLPLLLRMWNPPPPAGRPARALLLAQTPHAAWEDFLRRLDPADVELQRYAGDPNDIPAIWAHLQAHRIDRIICLDGAAWPAVWGMPGLTCLDFKTIPPGEENVIPEQWLPGYAAICADETLRRAWRERMPEEQLLSDFRWPSAD